MTDLTYKLCALILLATAQRVQTLHKIQVKNIKFFDDKCEILITEKLKHSKPGSPKTILKFERFRDNDKLCVVLTLKEYLKRSENVRNKSDGLFLCLVKPYGCASKDTLARWLKSVLIDAGINDFCSHSFRSASSTAMAKAGVAIEDILSSAGWSNAKTFRKFYDRSLIISSEGKKKMTSSEVKKNDISNYFQKLPKS